MKKFFDVKLQTTTYEIFAGEYFATNEANVVLITLLGSCVAVCLIDEANSVVGMNHFMLPGKFLKDKPLPINDPKYGTCAIDLLIKQMISCGAVRRNLKAKVFGAGRVIEHFTVDIANSNAEFIQKYLSLLKIPIVAKDLGGTRGRKVYFFSKSKEVLLKKINENGSG